MFLLPFFSLMLLASLLLDIIRRRDFLSLPARLRVMLWPLLMLPFFFLFLFSRLLILSLRLLGFDLSGWGLGEFNCN
jgi:hypothetical protein